MDQKTITTALLLTEDASDRDILDRIQELRAAAGLDAGHDADELSDRELIRRGEHESVSITNAGAVVTLYVPIKSGRDAVTELTIRRPNAGQLKRMAAAKGGDIGQGLTLLAETTGLGVTELEYLDAADLTKCMVTLGFLQRPPRRTGSSS